MYFWYEKVELKSQFIRFWIKMVFFITGTWEGGHATRINKDKLLMRVNGKRARGKEGRIIFHLALKF